MTAIKSKQAYHAYASHFIFERILVCPRCNGVVRQMADELGTWFPMHAQAMDAALALHLRSVGYDPVTGQVTLPQALPAETIHGCGGATCAPGQETAPENALTT